jgi:hypothetical protein
MLEESHVFFKAQLPFIFPPVFTTVCTYSSGRRSVAELVWAPQGLGSTLNTKKEKKTKQKKFT